MELDTALDQDPTAVNADPAVRQAGRRLDLCRPALEPRIDLIPTFPAGALVACSVTGPPKAP